MIVSPTLPPLPGYVEVEVNGTRTYRNVKTGLLITEELPPVEESQTEEVWTQMAEAIKEGVNEV